MLRCQKQETIPSALTSHFVSVIFLKKEYFRIHLQNKNFKCLITALYYNEKHLGAKNRKKKFLQSLNTFVSRNRSDYFRIHP